jgi:hypothetical protein
MISSRAINSRTFVSFQRSPSNCASPNSPSMRATAVRKLKLWSAASREADELEAGQPVHGAAQPTMHLDPGSDHALPRGQARERFDICGHDIAVGRQRRGQGRRRVAFAKYFAHPARVLEQIERTGDAALRQ